MIDWKQEMAKKALDSMGYHPVHNIEILEAILKGIHLAEEHFRNHGQSQYNKGRKSCIKDVEFVTTEADTEITILKEEITPLLVDVKRLKAEMQQIRVIINETVADEGLETLLQIKINELKKEATK